MAYFAFEGGVSTGAVAGSIEITEQQYLAAIDAAPSGQEITIDGGFALRVPKPSEHHVWEGGEWVDETPEPEPEPEHLPEEISRRQFYQGLAKAGFISKAEALAALEGVIPPAIMAVVDAIEDEEAQFDAMAHLKGSLSFMRHHPLVAIFAASQGLSEAGVDEFWRLCAALL